MNAVGVGEAEPFAQVDTAARPLGGRLGIAVFVAFATFVGWAVSVPLDSAVVSGGVLMSQGRNQTIQHLTGGTIRAIASHEGAFVRKGDLLIELEPSVDIARLSRLKAKQASLSATAARLRAEKALDGGERGEMNLALLDLRPGVTALDRSETAVKSEIETLLDREQSREFLQGRQAIEAQLAALERRAAGEGRRREGLREQADSARQGMALMESKARALRELADQGYVARRQVQDLEGQILEQRSTLARLSADYEASEQAIAELSAEGERVRRSDARETSQRLTDTLSELEAIRYEIAAAEQELGQTRIVAPADGHLVHFTANTPGSVVRAGERIADLVPVGAKLVARGRMSPDEITAVHVGQPAEIHISALPSRTTDPIAASMTYVAQDATQDERTGERYFEIEAALDLAGRKDIEAELSPGMSAQIFAKGTARTFAAYLLKPLTDALGRTFRER